MKINKRGGDGILFALRYIGLDTVTEIFARCLDILKSAYICQIKMNNNDNNSPQCVEIGIIDSIGDIATRILLTKGWIKRFADSRNSFVITKEGIKVMNEYYQTKVEF